MALDLYKYVASIPDYPEKGIIFRDILPLMADGEAFKQATDEITAFARERQVDMVVGPEARGFIVGCPVAYKLGVGFAPARKKGKLPRATVSACITIFCKIMLFSFLLSYNTALQMLKSRRIQ